jgi:hypothetical protein
MTKLLTATPLGRAFKNDLTIEEDVDLVLDKDVRAGPTTLLYAQLDNGANAGEKVYMKIFDKVTAVPGTDLPDIIFSAQTSSESEMYTSIEFANGLSFFCSQEPGNTATTKPTVGPALGRFVTTQ